MRPMSEIEAEAMTCALSWEPDAKLIGNVSAYELATLLSEVQRLRAAQPSAQELAMHDRVVITTWLRQVIGLAHANGDTRVGALEEALAAIEDGEPWEMGLTPEAPAQAAPSAQELDEVESDASGMLAGSEGT